MRGLVLVLVACASATPANNDGTVTVTMTDCHKGPLACSTSSTTQASSATSVSAVTMSSISGNAQKKSASSTYTWKSPEKLWAPHTTTGSSSKVAVLGQIADGQVQGPVQNRSKSTPSTSGSLSGTKKHNSSTIATLQSSSITTDRRQRSRTIRNSTTPTQFISTLKASIGISSSTQNSPMAEQSHSNIKISAIVSNSSHTNFVVTASETKQSRTVTLSINDFQPESPSLTPTPSAGTPLSKDYEISTGRGGYPPATPAHSFLVTEVAPQPKQTVALGEASAIGRSSMVSLILARMVFILIW